MITIKNRRGGNGLDLWAKNYFIFYPTMEDISNTKPPLFDHEKLDIYTRSLAFITWLEPILETLPKSLSARDQLDRASTSIVLNLAEGNGKFTKADRCRFFDIARGSALECAAGLDVLAAKGRCAANLTNAGKRTLCDIVSMLVGLIKANSDYRLHDEGAVSLS
jgi:four helix bundle protein